MGMLRNGWSLQRALWHSENPSMLSHYSVRSQKAWTVGLSGDLFEG